MASELAIEEWLKNEGNQTQSATDFAPKQSLTEYGGWHLPSGLLYHFFKGKIVRKERTQDWESRDLLPAQPEISCDLS